MVRTEYKAEKSKTNAFEGKISKDSDDQLSFLGFFGKYKNIKGLNKTILILN